MIFSTSNQFGVQSPARPGVGAGAVAAALPGFVRWVAFAGLVAGLALFGFVMPVRAEPGGLEGSWSGGGAVAFASGAKEKARCRATYNKTSSASYAMSASCATPSGKVQQTASLRKTGANRYAGHFVNSEYGVTGSIVVTVSGNSQSVSLSSDAGTGYFRLSK